MDESGPGSREILVVDDDAGQRSLLESYLKGQGYQVHTASRGDQALERLRQQPFGLMISDVRMPGMTGLETLHALRKTHPKLPVLMVTAYPDIRDAVQAMQDGAVDYLEKPIELDALLHRVQQALGGPTQPSGDTDRTLPPHVVAASSGMRQVLRDASLVAESESRILITGESGVGKEVLADLIHEWSHRAAGPLVKINCAAIPENLLESELFGHVKGAFSGATGDRPGKFEAAHGGTILLDEIGEMSAQLQAKLLRITQDGAFQRVGSNKDQHTDARLLTATNRELEVEVAEGRFREDLFYRLNVMELHIPPLRERHEDVLPLAEHFALLFSEGAARLAPALRQRLLEYPWPGNVRELRNAMERAVLMSRGQLILPDHLPPRIRKDSSSQDAPSKSRPEVSVTSLADLERDAILKALAANEYNRTETARVLGISRRSLIYKLRDLEEQGFQIHP